MVSNRKAKERIEFFQKLSAYKPVDSGGRFMNNIGGPIAPGRQNKAAWMCNYKFNIAFENASYPGYTTEKILEAFVSGAIPIYWGNPLIGLDFNPKAFINCHDFDSFDEVIAFIKEIDQDETLYKNYLREPILTGGVETDFCREENILARYNEIINNHETFVSPSRKRIQKMLYPAEKFVRKTAKQAICKTRKYINAAKRRILNFIN